MLCKNFYLKKHSLFFKGKGEVQASVLVEPGGGKDKDEDDEHFGSPTLNNSETKELGKDEERRGKNDNEGFGGNH